MWSDPIADMLTRIRNGASVKLPSVKIPSSNLKVGVAKVLKDEGYIRDYDVVPDDKQGVLRVNLKYGSKGEQIITSIKRISKGGKREYCKCKDLPWVLDGLGIAVISTSQGVLSDRECREKKIGGEVLCTVC